MEKGHLSLLNPMTFNYLYSESNFKDMGKLLKLTEKVYGRLTLIKFDEHSSWYCRCSCGNRVFVRSSDLARGYVKSCGCLRVDHGLTNTLTHGDGRRGKQAKEYTTWGRMKARCNNRNSSDFVNYGGRGIKVCKRWESYENFLADMGRAPSKAHTLDRIDNSKGYSPENCKWATRAEQARNTRQNRNITYNGVTKCISDWALDLGGNTALICKRLKRGWSIEDAITKPIRDNGYRQVQQ